jgi:hypothetical protein
MISAAAIFFCCSPVQPIETPNDLSPMRRDQADVARRGYLELDYDS